MSMHFTGLFAQVQALLEMFQKFPELLRPEGREEDLKRPACRTGSSQVHFCPVVPRLQASSSEGEAVDLAVDLHPPPVGTPLVSVSSVLCCVAPP